MQSIKDVIRHSRLRAYVDERAMDAPEAAQSPTEQDWLATVIPANACPKCRGAGFVRLDVPVGHPQFGRIVPCECKEREREADRYMEHRTLSNLDHYVGVTFETFDRDVPHTREALAAAWRYAMSDDRYEPPWIIFSGACGSGKTHLAAAIANEAHNQEMTVLFNVVPDLLDQLRAAYAPHSSTTFDDKFAAIREVGVLVLDDLGTENTTEWAREKLFQIINYRMTQRLPLVLTTNNARWDKQHGGFIFTGVDERIASRLSDVRMVQHVHIAADDYRRRQTGYTLPATPRPPARRYGPA